MTRKYGAGKESDIKDRWAVATLSGNANIATANTHANCKVFSWLNPEAADIMVDKVIMEITTSGGTDTSTLDVGVSSNIDDAGNIGDEFLDGVATNTAVGVYCVEAAGDMAANVPQNSYVGGKFKTSNANANASTLAGKVYIHYLVKD